MDKLTSGPGQWLLPLAIAGASVAAPKIGHGLTAGLGVLDWAQRNRKDKEEDKAFTELARVLGGVQESPTTSVLSGGAGTSEGQPAPTPSGAQPANPNLMGIPPSVLSNPKVARSVLPYILGNMEKMNTPREFHGVAGDQPGVYQSPGLGKPYTFSPVGPKNLPNFTPTHDAVSIELFNKPANQLGQEEMGRLNATITRRAEESKEFSDKLASERQEASQGRLMDKQIKAQEAARQKEDRGRAQQDWTGFNTWANKNFGKIEENYQKRIKEIPAPGSTIGKQKMAEFEALRDQERKDFLEEYNITFEDMKGRYSHMKEGLPWSGGGTPKSIELRNRKYGGESDEVLYNKLKSVNPTFAESFMNVIKNNPQAAGEARRRAKGMVK